MKKSIIILLLAIVTVSCEKYSDQLEVVKSDMKSKKITSEKEMELCQFQVSEVLGKDAMQSKKTAFYKSFTDLTDFGKPEGAKVYLDSINSIDKNYDSVKDKLFHKIEAYRLAANDTVFKRVYYLDDKNSIYDVKWIK